jgi:hypothetical protein
MTMLETFLLFSNGPLSTDSFPVVIFAVINGNVLKASGNFRDKSEIRLSLISPKSMSMTLSESRAASKFLIHSYFSYVMFVIREIKKSGARTSSRLSSGSIHMLKCISEGKNDARNSTGVVYIKQDFMVSFWIGAVERAKKSMEGMLYLGDPTTLISLKGRPGIRRCSRGNLAATRVKLGRHVASNSARTSPVV